MNSLTQNTQNTPQSCISMSLESDIRNSSIFSPKNSRNYRHIGAKLIKLLNDQNSLEFEKILSSVVSIELAGIVDQNSQTCFNY